MLGLTQYAFPLVSAVLILTLSLLIPRLRKRHLPYPPGPSRLPIIGNLLNMPSDQPWFTYKKWSDDFGSDIVHVDVMGSHMIVLNSAKGTRELLDKRSSIYSDRPQMAAFNLLGLTEFNHGVFPYGDRWRRMRHIFLSNHHPTSYRSLETRAARRLLRNLLSTPENFVEHLKHMTGQIVLSIGYGIDARPERDPYLTAAKEVVDAIDLASTLEARLLDMIPWLIYLPSWFPGLSIKRKARKSRSFILNTLETPYAVVKAAVASGTASTSIAANMISQLDENSTQEEIWNSKAVPGLLHLVTADTTVSAFHTFTLAMTLYPEAQRKAQAEIDSVTGGSRLPEFSDQDALPYVSAILKEVLRWHPVGPLGVPHRVMQDDVYEGYFIPAGSIIMANVWAILHDPVTFPEPDRFYPERWLSPDAPAFPDHVFGYGRRVCQGRVMAREVVWVGIASVLATFNIAAVDGKVPKETYTSDMISFPEPFVAHITPRSDAAADLISLTAPETT
ncbi:cytochrome P450 [Multifurca ochricompacta]|uniref:Cytochrome P450 n=1 Tax=Multifurca ochricompacta TaxID=376703 RepID=A0AAD4M077_9AGAM|nr:cytochrome P450 [Multifurca ochricompacta]